METREYSLRYVRNGKVYEIVKVYFNSAFIREYEQEVTPN